MVVEQRLITVDEYEIFLAEHPDSLYELIHGEIVEKVVTQEHGVIAVNIAAELRLHLRQHSIKGHVAVEARFRPTDSQHNDRLPDVSVHLTDKPAVKQGAVLEMPNLAVEVKSPTNSYIGLREKAAYYLDNGCQMVWLVYPEKGIVEVYQPDQDLEILLAADTLTGGDLLPGFTVPVATVFA